MKYWKIIVPSLPANAMAIYPFILFKDRRLQNDPVLINHEKIHLVQQLELCILPFYLLYFLAYLLNLIKYRNHYTAYFHIIFEREAYANDKDLNYLQTRKLWGWLHS